MRIGLVTKWFSSGQATVARYFRDAFAELGHETFILARPGSGPPVRSASPDLEARTGAARPVSGAPAERLRDP